MAEIYRNVTNAALSLDIEGATPTRVEIFRDNTLVLDVTTGLVPLLIPHSITVNDGPFEVRWTYTLGTETYSFREQHNIITPIFTEEEAVAHGLEFQPNRTYEMVERAVRYSIQAYTGQRFGYREGKLTMRGMGSYMVSPERIMELSGIDGYYGAWYISDSQFGVYSSLSGNYEGITFPTTYTTEDIATYSTANTNGFPYNRIFTVNGRFGWLEVPEDVKLAGLLIGEELLCNQSLWRDRYVRAIRASDWRFDFFDRSMTGTGSLHADQILDQYRRGNYLVV
jgi:hypothetical protein